MSTTEQAVQRLSAQLPLRSRQASLPDGLAKAHRAILRSFSTEGRPPTEPELEQIAGEEPASVIARLAADDLVVSDDGRISGAYPFTLEPTPHLLAIGDIRVNAMCALDAVAVAPMFDLDVVTVSKCAVTDAAIRIHQIGDAVQSASPGSVRVGVRWQQPDGCAAHSMCRDMVFLRDDETARRWRDSGVGAAGIFDLVEAIAFGSAFFGPLL